MLCLAHCLPSYAMRPPLPKYGCACKAHMYTQACQPCTVNTEFAFLCICSRFGENVEHCHPSFNDNTRVRLEGVPIYLMMARTPIPSDPATYAAVVPRPQTRLSSSSSSGSPGVSADGNLCGLALVAKGPVTITVRNDDGEIFRTYAANIEFVTGWSNGDINVPRLNEETTPPRFAQAVWETTTLDRACMYNDVPLVRPGSLRLDFVRELDVTPQQ